jgi:hypothetical protein
MISITLMQSSVVSSTYHLQGLSFMLCAFLPVVVAVILAVSKQGDDAFAAF